MNRIHVNPDLLRWARRRARLEPADLALRFPALPDWEDGGARPTLKQLERFARATFTPVGYLLLDRPPPLPLPIPDYRTISDHPIAEPSPNLLDTVFLCQQRQAWYRDYLQSERAETISFVGSLTLAHPVDEAAAVIRDVLRVRSGARAALPTWEHALQALYRSLDDTGVLAMRSGIVGTNTHRGLDPTEFRGFALVDRLAPLVFVNAQDSRSAQMFTLVHEAAHLFLGESGVSDADPAKPAGYEIERWCNAVAAEVLVPSSELEAAMRAGEAPVDAMPRLARRFRVSTLVVLRRLRDIGAIGADRYWRLWEDELARLQSILRRSSGGDFYRTTSSRLGARFARALVVSALEGSTLYRDAMRLAGVAKVETLHQLGRENGVAA